MKKSNTLTIGMTLIIILIFLNIYNSKQLKQSSSTPTQISNTTESSTISQTHQIKSKKLDIDTNSDYLSCDPLTPINNNSNDSVKNFLTVKLNDKQRILLLNLKLGKRAKIKIPFPNGDTKNAFVISRTIYSNEHVTAIGTDAGSIEIDSPHINFFIGRLENQPNSLVEFTVTEKFMSGTIWNDEETYRFGPQGNPYISNFSNEYFVYNIDEVSPEDWKKRDLCSPDSELANLFYENISNIYPEGIPEDLSQIPPDELPDLSSLQVTYDQLEIALEGDFELFSKFGNNQDAVFAYYAAMFNSINAIYQRDLQVDLKISFQRVWQTASDPYSSTSTIGSLNEVREYWTNNMSSTSRDLCHLISGKTVRGGVAYVGVLCHSTFGFGMTQVFGDSTPADHNGLWDLIAISHELGHNHNSPHTHCYTPAIDQCYNQDDGCYSGSVNVTKGTIMSYCHIMGGMSNIELKFHSRVQTVIRSFVNSKNCLEQVTNGPDLNFKAKGLKTTIVLNWDDPQTQGLPSKTVFIRRKIGSYPANSSDGDQIYTGTSFNFTDNSVVQGTTYFYRIWGDNGVGGYEDITFNDRGFSLADDGDMRIFWQSNTGTISSWLFSENNSKKSGGQIDPARLAPDSWTIRGIGDIDRDGTVDLIWQSNTGNINFWLLNPDGSKKSGGQIDPARLAPDFWTIRGVGDIDRDGTVDLIWQSNAGNINFWLLNPDGSKKSGGQIDPARLAPDSWTIRGVGDIDRDGTVDLIWQSNAGNINFWLLNPDGSKKSGGQIDPARLAPDSWTIRGVGDIDRDGTVDLIWQSNTGNINFWLLNPDGSKKSGGQIDPARLAPDSWTIRGIGDIDRDGTVDLIWQSNTGNINFWLLNPDGSKKSGGQIDPAKLSPDSWAIRGIGSSGL